MAQSPRRKYAGEKAKGVLYKPSAVKETRKFIGNSLPSQAQDKISAARKANVQVAENGLKKDGRSRDHPTRSNYNKTYAEDSMDVKIVVTGVGGKDGEGRTRNEERDHQKGGSFEKGGKRHKRAHTPHPRLASKPLHFSFSEAKCSPPKIKPPSTKPHPSHALTKHIEISFE